MKKIYNYETHLHTSEVSRCASASASEQVEYYSELGYSGVIVTDHFFNGNCAVPKDLPWKERVELFCAGYRNAFEEGKKRGIDVFFGWEYSFFGTDFLTYGLSPAWLAQNPQIMDMTLKEYCDFVHVHGGLVIHAHPFREANYISMIRLVPRDVDGAEVINACRTDFENRMAKQYIQNYGLLPFAGSDNHSAYAQKKLAGVAFKERIESIEDFVDMIRAGKYKIFEKGL
ncbi:MAG: PHP-associated domain-containing protein [Eubacteriales bacterium]